MKIDQDRASGLRQIALLTAIPALMVLGPLIGWWMGRFADRHWGTEPYLMLVGIVLGFIASGREVWKLIKLASGPDDSAKADKTEK